MLIDDDGGGYLALILNINYTSLRWSYTTFASCSCLFCFAKYRFIDNCADIVAIVATEGTDDNG